MCKILKNNEISQESVIYRSIFVMEENAHPYFKKELFWQKGHLKRLISPELKAKSRVAPEKSLIISLVFKKNPKMVSYFFEIQYMSYIYTTRNKNIYKYIQGEKNIG